MFKQKPRNIYIVGAQCTGKTTLVNALEQHFTAQQSFQDSSYGRPLVVKEVARKVLQQHAQVDDSKWFISDRSGIDPIIYAKQYVGEDAANELMNTSTWKMLEKAMRGSLMVVCEAGADWLTDDGVRLMPKDNQSWIELHDLFCESLDLVGLEYVVLSRHVIHLNERVDFVVRKWEERILE
ncbi:MAG: hypothetical protein Q9190_004238 [Brigantiaea leucoxantha]